MDAIVSVTNDWGIGLAGQLLVRNRADMRRFVDLTMGGTVLMGRKTLESFPGGPLKGRRNVVLTRDESYSPEGVDVVHSAHEALEAVSGDEHVWLSLRNAFEFFWKRKLLLHSDGSWLFRCLRRRLAPNSFRPFKALA